MIVLVGVGEGVKVDVGIVGVKDGGRGVAVSVGVEVGGAGVLVSVAVGTSVGMAIFPPTTAPALLKPITPTILKIAIRLPSV